MRRIRMKPICLMSDRERWNGYEAEKKDLLRKRLTPEQFDDELKKIIKKWKI